MMRLFGGASLFVVGLFLPALGIAAVTNEINQGVTPQEPLGHSQSADAGRNKEPSIESLSAVASSVIDAIHRQYQSITNMSCTVRREIDAGQGMSVETMSRVDWARGDRMRVQVLKGGGRRVVIDGTSVFVKHPGEEKPCQYRVEDQMPSQFANLRSVPASPEETLASLVAMDAAEGEPEAPFARVILFSPKKEARQDTEGVAAPKSSARVYIDSLGRVTKVNIASDAFDGKPASETNIDFKEPNQVIPGVWLFRRIETVFETEGQRIISTVRFGQIVVNEELPDTIFNPDFNF